MLSMAGDHWGMSVRENTGQGVGASPSHCEFCNGVGRRNYPFMSEVIDGHVNTPAFIKKDQTLTTDNACFISVSFSYPSPVSHLVHSEHLSVF